MRKQQTDRRSQAWRGTPGGSEPRSALHKRAVVWLLAAANTLIIAGPLSFASVANAASVTANDDFGAGFTTAEDAVLVTPNVLVNDTLTVDRPATYVDGFYINSLGKAIVDSSDTDVDVTLLPLYGNQSSGTAIASVDALGATGVANVRVDDTSFSSNSSTAGGFSANIVWSDIVVSGPTSTTDIAARGFLDGLVSVIEDEPFTNLIAQIKMTLSIAGTPPGGGRRTETARLGPAGANLVTSTAFDQLLQTPLLTIDTQFPITVELDLVVEAAASTTRSTGGGRGGVIADLAATLGGRPGDDVFVLPTGFTANSASGLVVDNKTAPPPTLAVQSFDDSATLGTVDHNGDGTFDYDPNGAFDALNDGETATDSFVYVATDGRGNTDTATVVIEITGQNPPPQADLAVDVDQATGTVNVGDTFSVVATVANNGPDTATDTELAWTDFSTTMDLEPPNGVSSTHGSCTDFAPGVCSLGDLTAGHTATVTFTFDQTPDNQPGDTLRIAPTATTTAVDPNPDNNQATADYTTTVGSQADLEIRLDGPADTLFYPDPITWTATITNNGPDDAHNVVVGNRWDSLLIDRGVLADRGGCFLEDECELGTIAQGDTATITYTATPLQPGDHPFEAIVITDTTETDTTNNTRSIAFRFREQPPVAEDDSYTADQGVALTTTAKDGVLVNDSDPNGTGLTVARTGRVSGGTLAMNPDGTFTFTPTPGFAGQASFTYVVTDGDLESDSATVTISVVNRPPVAVSEHYEVVAGDTITIDILANDTDPEGDVLRVTDTGPFGQLPDLPGRPDDPTDPFAYVAPSSTPGLFGFHYVVEDEAGNTAVAQLTVRIISQAEFRADIADRIATLDQLRLGQRQALLALLDDRGPTRPQRIKLTVMLSVLAAFEDAGLIEAGEAKALITDVTILRRIL